jgi:hypothetical protein
MWVRNRKEMTYRRRGKTKKQKKRSTGPGERGLSGASFAFQCAASLRLLLIVRHGYCRTSVHRVLPVPIRIRVGMGGERARQPR